ncbi:MAG: energy-coupling factor transporter transmembrane protein EcfT [Mariprofundaceae bacterium]|nr:energy-coupling factor transporter transmembrane protein EcfT [Mariprofundaceae bacterium]
MSGQITDAIARAAPLSRVVLGLSLLLTTALNNIFYIAAIQLLISVSFLIIITSGGRLLKESARLLCWLVIPILLLHALFTPGELLVKGMTIPVSIEGVQLGGWFALHLIAIFLSALVFSRLLGKDEWVGFLLRIPGWGERFVPYALLLNSGLKKNREIVRREYSNWDACGKKLRQLPIHITIALADTLNENKKNASELWHDWDQRVLSISDVSQSVKQAAPMVTAAAVFAAALLWAIYLAGRV